MTLTKVRQDASHVNPVDDSATDILLYDHATLDARCKEIWSKLWQRDVLAAWTEKERSQIMDKVVKSYSSVHQLHRLISKYSETLATRDDLPSHILAPLTLLDHLSSVFLDTTEHQMSLILGTLFTRMREYVGGNALLALKGIPHGMIAVAQILWIAMTNLRVRTTTRQEILQSICTQYMEMKEQLIRPLLASLLSIQNQVVPYCYAIILHAWSSFPLIVQGRYQLPVDDALSELQDGVKALQSSSTPSLTYWKTKLFFLQQIVLSDSDDRYHSLPFDWSIFEDASLANNMWTGSSFDMDEKNESVALWHLLCENMAFSQEKLVNETAERFAEVLVRSLVKNPSVVNIPGQYTIRSISETFFSSDVILDSPRLHLAVVQSLEKALHSVLDNTDGNHPKSSKKSTKLRTSTANAGEIVAILNLLEQVGFLSAGNGSVQFSLSLIWKAFEIVLDCPIPWTNDVNQKCNLPDFLLKFGRLIISVPSASVKYWSNTLIDFHKLVPKILKSVSSAESRNRFELLDKLAFQNARLMAKIIKCPEGIEECRLISDQIDTSQDLQLAAETLAFMLDAVLNRMDRPGAVKLGLEVLFRLADLYQKFFSECLAKWQATVANAGENTEASLGSDILVHSALVVNQSLRSALTKFERNSVKSSSERMETLKSVIPLDTAIECLVHTASLRTAKEMNLALCHVALTTRIHNKYSIMMFKKILKLFRCPSAMITDEEMPSAESVDSSEEQLDGLDDRALFQVLLTLSEQLKLKTEKEREAGSWDAHSRIRETNLSECADSFRELFSLFARHTKPHKLVPFLSASMRILILERSNNEASVSLELLFYKLLTVMEGCHLPALSKELVSLHKEMYERLAATINTSDYGTLLDALTLLRTLVRNQSNPEVIKIALSAPVYASLHQLTLTDEQFSALFGKCAALLFDVISNPRLISPMTTPLIIRATSRWLTAIVQRARRESESKANSVFSANRKSMMVRNASLVERLLGVFAKHQRVFSKLVVYIVAAYCQEAQHGTLYPEAKEHILAGLYRLMDIIDVHSRSMGAAALGVELREIYKTLVEDHQKFHRYRGLV